VLAAAEQDQVRALGRRQPQRARQRFEHVERGADVSSLLEPRVPGVPDSGQERDLFAPQPRRAPAAAVGEPDVLGLEARALRAQEVGLAGAAIAAFLLREPADTDVVRLPTIEEGEHEALAA